MASIKPLGEEINSLDEVADPPAKAGINDMSLLENKDAETTDKKIRYPRSIGFIISNEFCERFSYYGLRTILVFYLRDKLSYDDDTATVVYHTFTVFVYLFPLFGAMIADSWLGKFKTILFLSIVYACGNVIIALGAIPDLNLPVEAFTILGLFMVAMGTGGIKPCVAAFGGDQFILPQQAKQLAMFFSLFYFAVNSGSFISTFITPILRMDVKCFDDDSCYSLAFGVPGVLMVVSIFIFVFGRWLYIMKKPEGNIVLEVFKCIANAISVRGKQKKTNPREHWLDYAEEKFGAKFVSDVKAALRVLVLYLPLPVFWALFDQQGSRWTFQASRMDGQMGSFILKPDQMQVVNPLLILVFIPLFETVLYPLLALCKISRPLQKLTIGGILAGVAFLISGIVELELEKTYPVLPGGGQGQFRVFNGFDCKLDVTTGIKGDSSKFTLDKLGYYEDKYIELTGTKSYSFTLTPTDCPELATFPSLTHEISLKERHSMSFFIGRNGTSIDSIASIIHPFEDSVDKSNTGEPNVRVLTHSKTTYKDVKFVDTSDGNDKRFSQTSNNKTLVTILSGHYKITVGSKDAVKDLDLKLGGVYTFILSDSETSPGTFQSAEHVIANPNSIHMMWLIPQYVVITMGEVMFSVTGLQFSFSQAPISMKSVLQSFWLLAVCLGNIIVIIVAEAKAFDKQSSEFFLFAALMFVTMGLFVLLAMRYTYVKQPSDEDEDKDLALQAAPLPAKGVDNAAFKNDE